MNKHPFQELLNVEYFVPEIKKTAPDWDGF